MSPDAPDDEVPCLLVSPSGITVIFDKVQNRFRFLRRAGVVAVLPEERRRKDGAGHLGGLPPAHTQQGV